MEIQGGVGTPFNQTEKPVLTKAKVGKKEKLTQQKVVKKAIMFLILMVKNIL